MTVLAQVAVLLIASSLPIGAFLLYFEPFSPYFYPDLILHSWSVGMLFGLLAFSAVVLQFFLGSRIKALDRLFGQDRVLRAHGVLGVLIPVFLAGHVVTKNLSQYEVNLQVNLGQAAAALFTLVIVLSALLMSPVVLRRWQPLLALRRWTARRLRLRYQHLRAIHNAVSLAGILAAAHVLLASSTSENLTRPLFLGLWFVLGMGVYAHHRLVKPLLLGRAPWEVTEVRAEAANVWTIRLTPKGGEFRYRPGQFVYVAFVQPGLPTEEHPFTLSSGGDVPIALTVKAGGSFTARLGELRPGSQARVDGPYGLFTLDREPAGRPLVFLAGGIGITPFLGFLRSLPSPLGRNIRLLWNVRTLAEAFAHAELSERARKDGRFEYTLLLSREEVPGTHHARLTPETLSRLVELPPDAAYYLCGPEAQMHALIRALTRRGVPPARIHFERFAV